jgi:hypothetical protein
MKLFKRITEKTALTIDPTPYWYWADDAGGISLTDTFENARKLALEKLI